MKGAPEGVCLTESLWTLLPGSRHWVAWGKGPVSRSLVHLLVAHPKCRLADVEGMLLTAAPAPPKAASACCPSSFLQHRPPLGAVGPQERPSGGLEVVTVSPEDRFLNNESSAMATRCLPQTRPELKALLLP